MVHGLVAAGVTAPETILAAKAAVAIDTKGEGGVKQALADSVYQGCSFGFHRIATAPAVPGQTGADTVAADQPRRRAHGIDGRIAHQVYAIEVAAAVMPDAAWVDHRHKDQAHPFQLMAELIIPIQPMDQAVHPRQQYLSANPLDPMHAAEKADNRGPWRAATQFYYPDGYVNLADHDAMHCLAAQVSGSLRK